jgi:hypothetical protein
MNVLKHVRWTLLVAAAAGLSAGAAWADSAERTLVTDPDTLASFGFAPDTTVYIASGGDAANPVPQNYGGADPIMVSHLGVQFHGRTSSYVYDTQTGEGDVSYVAGSNFVDAQLHLPSGALLEGTRFWVHDADPALEMGLFLMQGCLPFAGPGGPTIAVLGQATSTGSAGHQSIVVSAPGGTVVDNNACSYWVRVRFGANGHNLQKARTQYRLQVSPAPAVATFPGDVPTTHPFFRFVEAMARSGLTGGCGAGIFCPDAPVTRGQLSVFLSVALGLHFPN